MEILSIDHALKELDALINQKYQSHTATNRSTIPKCGDKYI